MIVLSKKFTQGVIIKFWNLVELLNGIGFASQKGKTWIHTTGKYTDWQYAMSRAANQENFTASMADAASTIFDYFNNKGKLGFITVLANISLYCDYAGTNAPKPKIKDIGILASVDPVAIDKAGLDLVKKNVDTGTEELLNQINNLKGENTINIAEKIGVGTTEYNLINIDDKDTKNAGSLADITMKIILFILLFI